MLSWDEFDKEDTEVAAKSANAGHASEANMDRLDSAGGAADGHTPHDEVEIAFVAGLHQHAAVGVHVGLSADGRRLVKLEATNAFNGTRVEMLDIAEGSAAPPMVLDRHYTEVLMLDDELREMIAERAPISALNCPMPADLSLPTVHRANSPGQTGCAALCLADPV